MPQIVVIVNSDELRLPRRLRQNEITFNCSRDFDVKDVPLERHRDVAFNADAGWQVKL